MTVTPDNAVTPDEAAARFDIGALTEPPTPSSGGHIHRNWLLTTRDGRYLLQSLNTSVFTDIAVLQDNTVRIGEHLRSRGLISPKLRQAHDGAWWWQGPEGSAWRVFEFLEGRRLPGTTPADVAAAGRAFGRFSAALADLPGPPLRPTIHGFHDLPARQQAFVGAEADAPRDRLRASAAERAEATATGHLASAFAGHPEAIAHGDAKAANVLVDASGTLDPVVVDLDTTGPAPLVIDAGDLIRSCSARSAEDEVDLTRVLLDEDLMLAAVGGWAAALAEPVARAEPVAHPALPEPPAIPEPAMIVRAGEAICWEQAVRFLTDYLEGDRYYPVSRPAHNLDRARTQLRLLAQLVAREPQLEAAVARLISGRG